MKSSWRVAALWLGLGVLSLAAVIGRGPSPPVATLADTLIISGTCTQCEIQLERVAILGGADLPIEFGNRTSLAVMSDGRYLATPILRSELAVFDAAGQFERVVGRMGKGPGEFQSIKALATGPGDTVYVLESGGLVTRLDAGFRYIDRIILQTTATPQGWTVLPSGELALVVVPTRTSTPPNRVHIVGSDGRVRASFARAPRAYPDPGQDYNETVGAVGASHRYGGLWFSKWNDYALQLFVGGRLRKVLVRDADWFRPWEGPDVVRNAPKRPTIEAVAERPDGLLTVIATVVDANFDQNRAVIILGQGLGETRAGTLPLRLMWDSVVEIIDPETGEIVGAVRSDDYLRSPVGGDGTLLYAAREDDIGRYRVFVYRVVLPDEPSG